ncbi:hypothetical protein LXL04_029804 [Taraxacum kok-saghyz]
MGDPANCIPSDPPYVGTQGNYYDPPSIPDPDPILIISQDYSDPSSIPDPDPISVNSKNPAAESPNTLSIPDLNKSIPLSNPAPTCNVNSQPPNRATPKTPHRRPPISIKLKDKLRFPRPSQCSSQRSSAGAVRSLSQNDLSTQDSRDCRVAQEADITLDVGKCLGFNLDGHEDKILHLVKESGVDHFPQ